MKNTLIVLKPFKIMNPSGCGWRMLQTGDVIDARGSRNVWITAQDGVRGKVECGSVEELLSGAEPRAKRATP